MNTLTITCNNTSIELSRPEARELELNLNMSLRGREYNFIGDQLYNFHTRGSPTMMQVSFEEFFFLKSLI